MRRAQSEGLPTPAEARDRSYVRWLLVGVRGQLPRDERFQGMIVGATMALVFSHS